MQTLNSIELNCRESFRGTLQIKKATKTTTTRHDATLDTRHKSTWHLALGLDC